MRYRVYLTDLVTAVFEVEARTPLEAADEVAACSTLDGEFLDGATSGVEVYASEDLEGRKRLYSWPEPEVKP